MYKSMYDILNKQINYYDEYDKLLRMIYNEKMYSYNRQQYTLIDIFDQLIVNWRYKGTKCSAVEVVEALNIPDYPNSDVVGDILLLCDFIVNVRTFLEHMKKTIEDRNEDAKIKNSYNFGNYLCQLYIYDKKLEDLVKIIMDSLNYEVVVEDDYKCYLIKKNSDVEETLKVVDDEGLSQKILRYNDYRIINNIEVKKEILLAMGNYFEGIRTKVREFNEDLESNIGYLLNSFNIRHNNLEGQYAKTYMTQIKDEELLKIYDMTYFLLLMAIRGIELPQFNSEIKLLKQKYNS